MSARSCSVCRIHTPTMKRCRNCHEIVYCSSECQKKDWPNHRNSCQKAIFRNNEEEYGETITGSKLLDVKPKVADNRTNSSLIPNNIAEDLENHVIISQRTSATQCTDEKSSMKDEKLGIGIISMKTSNVDASIQPVENAGERCHTVLVKHCKMKHKIKIPENVIGEEAFEEISAVIKVPMVKLKLIHKGKLVTARNICGLLQNNALFQAIGEQSANEEGLVAEDVEILMNQMGVDRNSAVHALRKNKDVLDAMLALGNK